MRYQPPEWQHHSEYKGWAIEHRPQLQRRAWRIVQGKRRQAFDSLEKCKQTIDKRTA